MNEFQQKLLYIGLFSPNDNDFRGIQYYDLLDLNNIKLKENIIDEDFNKFIWEVGRYHDYLYENTENDYYVKKFLLKYISLSDENNKKYDTIFGNENITSLLKGLKNIFNSKIFNTTNFFKIFFINKFIIGLNINRAKKIQLIKYYENNNIPLNYNFDVNNKKIKLIKNSTDVLFNIITDKNYLFQQDIDLNKIYFENLINISFYASIKNPHSYEKGNFDTCYSLNLNYNDLIPIINLTSYNTLAKEFFRNEKYFEILFFKKYYFEYALIEFDLSKFIRLLNEILKIKIVVGYFEGKPIKIFEKISDWIVHQNVDPKLNSNFELLKYLEITTTIINNNIVYLNHEFESIKGYDKFLQDNNNNYLNLYTHFPTEVEKEFFKTEILQNNQNLLNIVYDRSHVLKGGYKNINRSNLNFKIKSILNYNNNQIINLINFCKNKQINKLDLAAFIARKNKIELSLI